MADLLLDRGSARFTPSGLSLSKTPAFKSVLVTLETEG